MRQKLHRGRRSVFRRRSPLPRIIGGIVATVAVVALGFFGAKWVNEHNAMPPTDTSTPAVSAPATSAPADTTPTNPTTPNTSADADTVRGFYLPFSALTGNDLTATLNAAKQAGFNAVLFDLKDAEGNLYYRFTSAGAVQVNSFTANALTAEQLKSLFSTIRGAGLIPIPRLYAFQDNLGAKALADARISHKNNSGWVWYDGNPQSGGKAWLNPYADAAHSYVIGLATELKGAGAAAVMLDGVQFPRQTSSASFGSSANTSLKQDEILALFTEKARQALGTDCPLLLTCTAESALGTATQVYGGNPLTFGATMASPVLSYGADIQDSVKKMILRTQVLEKKPTVTPMLRTDGLAAAQVTEAVGSIVTAGTNHFILYAADGRYDFAAYNLP